MSEAPARVVRRPVQALLRLGQQVEPGEEEGHRPRRGPWRARGSAGRDRCRPRPRRPRRRSRTAAGSAPGSSGTGSAGWFGCSPVSAVEPSPIGADVVGSRRRAARPCRPPSCPAPGTGRLPRPSRRSRSPRARRRRGAQSEPEQSPSADVAHGVPISVASVPAAYNWHTLRGRDDAAGSADRQCLVRPSRHRPITARAPPTMAGPVAHGRDADPGSGPRPRTPWPSPSPAWRRPADAPGTRSRAGSL